MVEQIIRYMKEKEISNSRGVNVCNKNNTTEDCNTRIFSEVKLLKRKTYVHYSKCRGRKGKTKCITQCRV